MYICDSYKLTICESALSEDGQPRASRYLIMYDRVYWHRAMPTTGIQWPQAHLHIDHPQSIPAVQIHAEARMEKRLLGPSSTSHDDDRQWDPLVP